MEEWIDIVKERLQDAQAPLPPNDWVEFAASSLPARRTRVLPWLLPALAVAAAAALFVILKPREESGTVPDQPVAAIERLEPDVPVTVAEVLPSTTTPLTAYRKPTSVPTVFPQEVYDEPAIQADDQPEPEMDMQETETDKPDNPAREQAQEPAKNEEISANATDFEKLSALSAEKEQLEAALSEKMDRWVYLNELAEKIRTQ